MEPLQIQKLYILQDFFEYVLSHHKRLLYIRYKIHKEMLLCIQMYDELVRKKVMCLLDIVLPIKQDLLNWHIYFFEIT